MTSDNDIVAILPSHIDSTMRSAFVKCKQSFFTEFVLGLRPARTSIHLHAGGAFSGALERFYTETWTNHEQKDIALARSHQTFLNLWGNYEYERTDAKSRENIWAAVESYVATYPPASDPVQPYIVEGKPTYEFSFAIPLDDAIFPRHPVTGDPFIYVGRADLLGTYYGRPVIRDEKTAGRLESNWSEHWDMRGQFLGYCWAAQRGGINVSTVVVRGVILTKTNIRQVEAIKLYSHWEIERWYQQLARDLHSLVKCWNDGWFDYNLGEACSSYGGCVFLPRCKSPVPSRHNAAYVVKRWNPLLRNPVDEEQSRLFPAVKTVSIGSASTPTSAIAATS